MVVISDADYGPFNNLMRLYFITDIYICKKNFVKSAVLMLFLSFKGSVSCQLRKGLPKAMVATEVAAGMGFWGQWSCFSDGGWD